MNACFEYVKDNEGITSNATYPYKAVSGTCKYNEEKSVGSCAGFVDIPRSDAALQEAVATIGPISVAIDASLRSLHLYSNGIYNDPACTTKTNHAGEFSFVQLPISFH
jgi:hypothetical protein